MLDSLCIRSSFSPRIAWIVLGDNKQSVLILSTPSQRTPVSAGLRNGLRRAIFFELFLFELFLPAGGGKYLFILIWNIKDNFEFRITWCLQGDGRPDRSSEFGYLSRQIYRFLTEGVTVAAWPRVFRYIYMQSGIHIRSEFLAILNGILNGRYRL